MSLPSITQVAQRMGIDPHNCKPEEQETLLVGAMRADLPLAVALVEQKAAEAKASGANVPWLEDPQSEVGKQLIRMHASDPLRVLASKHFAGGQDLTFINCCGGGIGKKPDLPALIRMQVEQQAGPIAYPNC